MPFEILPPADPIHPLSFFIFCTGIFCIFCESLKFSQKVSNILRTDIVSIGNCIIYALESGWVLDGHMLPGFAIFCIFEFPGKSIFVACLLRLDDNTFISTSLNGLDIAVRGRRKVEPITFVVSTRMSRMPLSLCWPREVI